MATMGINVEMEVIAAAALLEFHVTARVFNQNHPQVALASPACAPPPPSRENIDNTAASAAMTAGSTPASPKRARSPSSEREIIHLPDGGMIIRNNKLRRLREQGQAQPSDALKPRDTEPPKKKPVQNFLYKRYLKERREAKRIAKQREQERKAKIAKQKAMQRSKHYTEHKQTMKDLRANTKHLLDKIEYLKGKWEEIRENITNIVENDQEQPKPSTPEPRVKVYSKPVNMEKMIKIGGREVSTFLIKQIEGTSHTYATRKLLSAVFSRSELATHSLTGKSSPAFPNKPPKKKLDPAKVKDIIRIVCEKCNVHERDVRNIITTKCADECKMFRLKERAEQNRNSLSATSNKENTPTDSEESLDDSVSQTRREIEREEDEEANKT